MSQQIISGFLLGAVIILGIGIVIGIGIGYLIF